MDSKGTVSQNRFVELGNRKFLHHKLQGILPGKSAHN